MKSTALQAALGSALLLLSAPSCSATHSHQLVHARHLKAGRSLIHDHLKFHDASRVVPRRYPDEAASIQSRAESTVCKLPDHPDIVPVTDGTNGGWAIPPDRMCTAGNWCPFACKPGKVMAQWKPGSKVAYPESMYGGLFCEASGVPSKPFPSKPYCVDGTGAVSVVNKVHKVVSFCQTTYPGDESMVIRNDITDTSVLAVPDADYWESTAAHYYVNPPGVDGSSGCKWGTPAKDTGNWSPYVAGMNTVANGMTYVKVGVNPIWQGSALAANKPKYGLEIKCAGNGCNGLPCKVSADGVDSPVKATGAGDANYCVVTVPKGEQANIVVWSTEPEAPAPPPPPPSTSSPPPAPSPTPTTTSSSSTVSSSSSKEVSTLSSSRSTTSIAPGIFHENGTYTSTTKLSGSSGTLTPPSVTQATAKPGDSNTPKNDAGNTDQGSAAVAGLVVALVAGIFLY